MMKERSERRKGRLHLWRAEWGTGGEKSDGEREGPWRRMGEKEEESWEGSAAAIISAVAAAAAGAHRGQAEPDELRRRSASPTFLWNAVFTLHSKGEGGEPRGCEGDGEQGRKSSLLSFLWGEGVWGWKVCFLENKKKTSSGPTSPPNVTVQCWGSSWRQI